jgi:cytochrome c oxidase subunit III
MSGIQDLSSLPRDPGGRRGAVYWGVILLIVIEGTVMASLITSYFYLRVMTPGTWPPAGIDPPDLLPSALGTAALVASMAPVMIAVHATRRGQGSWVFWTLVMAVAFLAIYLAFSLVDARARPYGPSKNAYASIVFTLTGYQTAHAIGLLLFAGLVALMVKRKKTGAAYPVAVEALALYWYFVALAGVPTYATLYLAPYLL